MCELTLAPERCSACPGETVELRYRASGLDDVTLRWHARSDEAAPATAIRLDGGPRSGRLLVDLPPSIGDGVHTIRLIVEDGGSPVAEARAAIEVDRSIRFVASSLSWDPSSVSGTISVRNCTLATPKLTVRLRCRGGRLVIESAIGASVTARGVGTLSFDLPDLPPVEVGSCRMELVGDDGQVLDSIDLAESLQTSDGDEGRERRPDRRLRVGRAMLGAVIVGVIAVVAILFWPTNGPDPPDGREALLELSVEQDDFGFRVFALSVGDADLSVGDIELLGPDAFRVIREDCIGAPVAPGAACTIDVVLEPPSEGRYDAELRVLSNATNSPSAVAFGADAVF